MAFDVYGSWEIEKIIIDDIGSGVIRAPRLQEQVSDRWCADIARVEASPLDLNRRQLRRLCDCLSINM
jgi:hypothetical protein